MLTRAKTGLLLIDVQGTLARRVADSEQLIANVEALIKGLQALDLPVVWVEQNPDKLGATVTELAQLLPSNRPVTKFSFDACASLDVMQHIETSGCQQWLVAGIEAHICVYQTCAHLHTRGYETHLVVDAISSRAPSNKSLAIQKLQQLGVHLTSVEMCLYELVKDCRDPAFRTILQSVKAASD